MCHEKGILPNVLSLIHDTRVIVTPNSFLHVYILQEIEILKKEYHYRNGSKVDWFEMNHQRGLQKIQIVISFKFRLTSLDLIGNK